MNTKTQSKLLAACSKELAYVSKLEFKFQKEANKEEWQIKTVIIDKIPDKVEEKLEAAFCKAFEIIFTKGTGVVEKTYDKNIARNEYKIQDFTVDVRGTRGELKKLYKGGRKKQNVHTVVSAVEGVGLGVLGIGLPDIIGFVVVLLRGVYEICMQYGFDYSKPEEQYFILKMIESALSKKHVFLLADSEVNALLLHPKQENLSLQIRKTAQVMATDMIMMKFIQGIPLVGVIGGIGNPVYCNKIMKYVRIKYYKRYLLEKMASL